MSQFEYDVSLTDHRVRLLTLLPENASQAIEVELKTVSLHHDLNYAAISYCWGGPQAKRRSIRCNGRNLEVTDSLYGALSCLRSETMHQTLWADAVCINQSDVNEKNTQVPLMGTIYRRASHVYVWLGKLKKINVRALRWAEQLTGRNPTLHIPAGVHLYRTLSRPWFRRVWVIQEIAMSGDRAVILASPTDMISWPDFIRGCKLMVTGISNEKGNLSYALKLEEARKKLSASLTKSATLDPLLIVLTTYRWFEATDPRDKIYALLGITRTDALSQRIHIDYSISFQELCRRLACVHLQWSGNLSLLSMPSFFPRSPTSNHATLTTWQPDWSMPDWTFGDLRKRAPRPMSIFRGKLDLTHLEALPKQEPMVSISDDRQYLRLSGILVDTVNIVGQCSDLEGYGMRPDQRVTFRGLFAKTRLHLTAFFEAEKIADVTSTRIYAYTGEDLVTVFGSILLSRYKMENPANEIQRFCSWYSSLTWLRAVHAIQYGNHPFIYWLALIPTYSFHYFPKTVS